MVTGGLVANEAIGNIKQKEQSNRATLLTSLQDLG